MRRRHPRRATCRPMAVGRQRFAGWRRGLRYRRRLPGRRRLLERNRILDGALVEGVLLVCKLQEFERQQPRALAAVPAALHHCGHGNFELFRTLQCQREAVLSRIGQRIGEQARACVVESGDRGQVQAGVRHLLLDRPPHALDLRSARGRELARDGNVAPGDDLRPGGRRQPFLPRRRRTFELHNVLQRHLLERRAIVGPLQNVEQRQPRKRRNLGVVIRPHALLQQRARRLHLPAREQQRGILENAAQSRIGLRDLDRRIRGRPFHQAGAADADLAGRLDAGPFRDTLLPLRASWATSRAETAARPNAACGPSSARPIWARVSAARVFSTVVWRTKPSLGQAGRKALIMFLS